MPERSHSEKGTLFTVVQPTHCINRKMVQYAITVFIGWKIEGVTVPGYSSGSAPTG